MQPTPGSDYYLVLVIFTAITALSLLIQACSLLAMFIVLRKSVSKMQGLAEEMKAKALPTIASAQALIDDVGPKLKTATSQFSEISQNLRHQAYNINETMDNALVKANAQIRRIDEMVTGTMDAVDNASRAIESAVAVPTRRVSGIIHGVRVGLGVFLGREKEVMSRVASAARPEPQPRVVRTEPPVKTENPRTVEFPQQRKA
jgi:flagellar hook-basal body complex protein FliE